jgi:DNA-binding LacI/PurR family transcriptional regulator
MKLFIKITELPLCLSTQFPLQEATARICMETEFSSRYNLACMPRTESPNKRINLTDVAQHAGVSLATASLVLNDFSKQDVRVSAAVASRVRQSAKILGYVGNYHARSMRTGQSETIGLVLEMYQQLEQERDRTGKLDLIGNAYFQGVIAGVEFVTHHRGYGLTLIGPTKSQLAIERAAQFVANGRVDGLIVPSTVPGVWGPLSGAGLPIDTNAVATVLLQPTIPVRAPAIEFDHAMGISQAVDHLLSLGHASLAWTGPDDSSPWNSAMIREREFVRRLFEARLPGRCIRIPHAARNVESLEELRPDGRGIVRLAESLVTPLRNAVRDDGVTGVVCYNDEYAVAVVRALRRLRVEVPRHVAVVGFDDGVAANACIPSLTSVDHRFADLGSAAADYLLEILDFRAGRREDAVAVETRCIQPRLTIRESTARPSQSGPMPE